MVATFAYQEIDGRAAIADAFNFHRFPAAVGAWFLCEVIRLFIHACIIPLAYSLALRFTETKEGACPNKIKGYSLLRRNR